MAPLPPSHAPPTSHPPMKSLDPIRPSSRRAASGAWSRLKPVREDLLDHYGLPSKGETRLNDFKTQQLYFNRIIERYMKLCALNREELDRLFASVGGSSSSSSSSSTSSSSSSSSGGVKNSNLLSSSFSSLSLSKHAPPPPLPVLPPSSSNSNSNSNSNNNNASTASLAGIGVGMGMGTGIIPANAFAPSINELAIVLAALRKLREAITASNRCDHFARRAYFFAVHVAVLCHDWSSYLPALSSLLTHIHPRNPLEPHDLKEYVGLLILDQACRQSDLALARATKIAYGYKDWRVEGVLRSLVMDDYVAFWRLRRAVDGYQRSVMEFAQGGMRVHALKCLGRSYMSADRRFVERCTDRQWEELVKDGVGWELSADGEKVVIRKPKGS